MIQQILVKLLATLLAKLGGYIIDLVTEIMEETKIKRKQQKKKKAMDAAKSPDEIKSAHRSNSL